MIGTILLAAGNYYVKADGSLPTRPDFDKDLLTAICKGSSVSIRGYTLLPPSIQEVTSCLVFRDPGIAITIPELGKASILIVVRSLELVDEGAKQFRLDKHRLLIKQRDIEIWELKDEFR